MIFSIINRLYKYNKIYVHYYDNTFYVITKVRSPYLAKSEHAYVIKSESSAGIFGWITVSAPFKYNVIFLVCCYFTIIAILLLYEVNANIFNISYLYIYLFGPIIYI